MLCFPNAKINIGLNVVEKRSDGFHNIETIFYPIPLKDALEIGETDKDIDFEITTTGIDVEVDPRNNIVAKAYELVNSEFKLPSSKIHLHKNIPFGAGLGGGSADAAFMIRLLNDHYQLNMSIQKMEDLACQLGSDCPFFIENKAVYAKGKGEIFSPINVNLKDYHFLMIKPDIHISTPEAYRGIVPKSTVRSVKELIQLPIEEWKNHIHNDFEDSIFPNHPELARLKQELYDNGAIYAAMSGSGSTIFGIFKQNPKIKKEWKQHFTFSCTL